VFDAGFKAVALCGKSLPIYLRAQFLQATQGSRLVVMLDPDAAAESLRLAEQYDGVVAVCPAGKDPGDMTGPEISKAISDAVRSAEEVSHDM
jgi:DNA primase